LTHDDMQGVNKMCNIEKSKINRPIGEHAHTDTTKLIKL
jgi:hypothetical protein